MTPGASSYLSICSLYYISGRSGFVSRCCQCFWNLTHFPIIFKTPNSRSRGSPSNPIECCSCPSCLLKFPNYRCTSVYRTINQDENPQRPARKFKQNTKHPKSTPMQSQPTNVQIPFNLSFIPYTSLSRLSSRSFSIISLVFVINCGRHGDSRIEDSLINPQGLAVSQNVYLYFIKF